MKNARSSRHTPFTRTVLWLAWTITLFIGLPHERLVPAQALTAADRLGALRAEIERLESESDRLGGEREAIWAELARLTARRDLMQVEATVAVETLDRLDRAATRAEGAALAADRRGRQAAADLGHRLRALRRGQGALTHLALLAGDGPTAAVEALRRLSDRAALDRVVVVTARETRADALQAAVAAARGRVEVDQARQTARGAERAAAAALAERERRLAEVRGREDLFTQAMAEVTGAAQALEDFLVGNTVEAPGGPDPRRLRGTLAWPTSGEVRIPFGPRRHRRFGTTVPHNGIAIAAGAGTSVRATAAGTVLYADWFQSYGRTVIVDHGSGIITVSSRLESFSVARDQVVRAGQALGTVGDSGTPEDVHLYFEIRDGGRPVQPLDWLGPPR